MGLPWRGFAVFNKTAFKAMTSCPDVAHLREQEWGDFQAAT